MSDMYNAIRIFIRNNLIYDTTTVLQPECIYRTGFLDFYFSYRYHAILTGLLNLQDEVLMFFVEQFISTHDKIIKIIISIQTCLVLVLRLHYSPCITRIVVVLYYVKLCLCDLFSILHNKDWYIGIHIQGVPKRRIP